MDIMKSAWSPGTI